MTGHIDVHSHTVVPGAQMTDSSQCHGVSHVHQVDYSGLLPKVMPSLVGTPLEHSHLNGEYRAHELVATATRGVEYDPTFSDLVYEYVLTDGGRGAAPNRECIERTKTGYERWCDEQLEKDMGRKPPVRGIEVTWWPLRIRALR